MGWSFKTGSTVMLSDLFQTSKIDTCGKKQSSQSLYLANKSAFFGTMKWNVGKITRRNTVVPPLVATLNRGHPL